MLRAAARKRPLLAASVAAMLIVGAVYGGITGARLTIPYIVVVALFTVVLAIVDERFDLGTRVLWLFATWGAAHLAGGLVALDGDRVLYNAVLGVDVLRYDRIVHMVGFGTATFACGIVLTRWLPSRPFDAALATMAVLAGMGIGGLNEMVEFIMSLLIEETNVGGYDNTGWDLIFDFVGSIVAAVLLTRSSQRVAEAR